MHNMLLISITFNCLTVDFVSKTLLNSYNLYMPVTLNNICNYLVSKNNNIFIIMILTTARGKTLKMLQMSYVFIFYSTE